ncbi:MAG: tetratricopeptide repeat protein [Methylophilales bacterium]|nr:tetratricopeptide repeat protein [Pseudomonadota bacterium]NQW34838.1 tetratricopeptide repeat protein [Methylophilales bacterium]|tara:strand:- start:34 stop:1605 length:1572 start_codon:yes stop_codon:yes gene_type:complete
MNFDPNELSKKGLTFLQQGRFIEAAEIFDKLILYFPKNHELYNIIGFVNLELKKYDLSINAYNKSLTINQNQPEAFFNRALANSEKKYLTNALSDYQKVIEMQPGNINAYINIGTLYEDIGRLDEALDIATKAYKIDSANIKILANRANLYQKLFLNNRALDDLNSALNIEPNNIDLIINHANVLKGLHKFQLAKKSYQKAISINPKSANAHFHYGLLLLLEKNFDLGWQEYEYRWNLEKYNKPEYKKRITEYKKDIKNGSLLIWGEQGIGDQIFFVSLIKSLPKTLDITITTDKKLINFLSGNFDNVKFISYTQISSLSFDYQISFFKLGSLFISSKNIYKNISLLSAKTENVIAAKFFIKKLKKVICGVSWRTNNIINGYARSVSLLDLLPVFSKEHISFIDLQYGDTNQEKKDLNKKYGIKINTNKKIDNFNDIDGLAGLIESCDYVITIDNTVAHLCGALGKKTYLLLPYGVGNIWYWHDDITSLRYPTVKIFRQSEPGNWLSPIKEISDAIDNLTLNK